MDESALEKNTYCQDPSYCILQNASLQRPKTVQQFPEDSSGEMGLGLGETWGIVNSLTILYYAVIMDTKLYVKTHKNDYAEQTVMHSKLKII